MSTYQPLLDSLSPISKNGLNSDAFTIINNGTNFSIKTKILFDSIIGKNPKVEVKLSANSLSSSINYDNFQNLTNNDIIYHIIFDYNNSQPAIFEYTWQSNEPILTNIVSSGVFSTESYIDFLANLSPNSIIGFSVSNILYNTNMYDISLEQEGTYSYNIQPSRFKLGSTFYLKRQIIPENIIAPDCLLDCKLNLNNETIGISGGSNYRIGETFTVNGGEIPGLLSINNVDSNGSITEIIILDPGYNFTTLPNVQYNGVSGTNADIVINDNFNICNISIINHGTGYTTEDNIIGAKYNNIEYNYSPLLVQTSILDTGLEGIVNDNFSLNNITVLELGNNITSNSTFKLISDQNIINHQNFISLNTNNITDLTTIQLNNRNRFFSPIIISQ